MTATAFGSPKCAATASVRLVAGPRPLSAREQYQSTSLEMPSPPPQSPEIRPSAGKRTREPSGPTPTLLMPAPQTTATPNPALVPVRSMAKVSFSTTTSRAQPCATIASLMRSSSMGRSALAR